MSCLGGRSTSTRCTEITTTGIALLSIAGIAYIGGVFYDVLDAPDAVDRFNHAHRVMVITPGPMMSPTGGPPGGGVWIQGVF